MNRLYKNKSEVFLMELILVVFFISLTFTICVRIFVAGEGLSKKSYTLTNAVIQAENAVKLMKQDSKDIDAFQKYYGTKTVSGKGTVYFDEAFQLCTKDGGERYEMIVAQEKQDTGMYVIKISFFDLKKNEEIYHLDTKRYVQGDEEK